MTQECQVYYNIDIDEKDKEELVEYINKQLKKPKFKTVFGEVIDSIEVIDDMPGLIVIDLYIKIDCSVVTDFSVGCSYVDNYYEEEDFYDWINSLIDRRKFDCEIEIDDDSNIPTAEELMEAWYWHEKY
jgi:hypothetical protein